MIIYAETRRRFLEDVDLNRLERRLVEGFERQTRHRRLQWNDSGSESRIRDAAKKFKAHVHPPFTLTAQFRCGGSDG